MDPVSLIVLGIVGLLGLLWTVFGGKPKVSAGPLDDHVEQEAQVKADKETAAAEIEHDKTVAQAKADHDQKNDELVHVLENEEKELLSNDDALNEHLKDVGKSVRGDG